jgi:hypothetical protein
VGRCRKDQPAFQGEAGRVVDHSGAKEPTSVSAVGIRVSNLPTWVIWSIVVAAVLSPVLAFLMAIVVEILIGALLDAGILPFLALATAGAVGSPLLRKLWARPRERASVKT